jgi:hypothetical protein
LYTHAVLTGVLTFVLILCPQYMVYQRLIPAAGILTWAIVLGIAAALLVILVTRRFGVQQLRLVTMIPLVILLYFLLGRNGRLLDLNYSARPLAREIQQADPNATVVAELNVRRDLVYGLAFYRDQQIVSYADGGVPEGEHLVVFPTRDEPLLENYLKGRFTQPLLLYEAQGLSVYRVYPRS